MYICILLLKKKVMQFFYDIREEYNNAKRGRGLEWVEGVCALDNSKKKVSCFYRSLSNIDPVKLGASGYKINNEVSLSRYLNKELCLPLILFCLIAHQTMKTTDT